jgi:polyisoprenoid-binding protein YceI
MIPGRRSALFAAFGIAAGWMLGPPAAGAAVIWHNAPSPARLVFFVQWESSTLEGRFPAFHCLLETTSSGQPRLLKVGIATRLVHFQSPLLEGPARSATWFDIRAYPRAVFSSHEFRQVGPEEYQAVGTLLLKGIQHPVRIQFTLQTPRPGALLLVGTGRVRRQDFGIGSGTWQKSSVIGSQVTLRFRVGFIPGP